MQQPSPLIYLFAYLFAERLSPRSVLKVSQLTCAGSRWTGQSCAVWSETATALIRGCCCSARGWARRVRCVLSLIVCQRESRVQYLAQELERAASVTAFLVRIMSVGLS